MGIGNLITLAMTLFIVEVNGKNFHWVITLGVSRESFGNSFI